MTNIDLLTSCGFKKPVTKCTRVDVPTIVQTVTLQHVILDSKAELDQLSEGLCALGVLDVIKTSPNLLRPLLTRSGAVKLTAGESDSLFNLQGCFISYLFILEVLRDLFKIIHFSEKGTTARVKEEAAYIMLRSI